MDSDKSQLIDEFRITDAQRNPELGPRILFFTGGTAMRGLSRQLKRYTHNSIHLITPFDSGGSSAKLRAAFNMLSVGDIRNRLVALADDTLVGAPQIYDLFSYRFSHDSESAPRYQALRNLADGSHNLAAAAPKSIQKIVGDYLQYFCDRMPEGFDLRGASIGNLLLAGGYLQNDRDLATVLAVVSEEIKVLGKVSPITEASLHLLAELEDGTKLIGQDRITGKEHPPITSAICNLSLVDSVSQPADTTVEVSDQARELIGSAELICFPMGSFWTSVVANLLPEGVGQAIVGAQCPKLYIPNVSDDPEQLGLKIHDCVRILHRKVCEDAGETVPLSKVLDRVLVDSKNADYAKRLDTNQLATLGVRVLDAPLVTKASRPLLDSTHLAQALVSMT
jgi:CofD-related protein of GAK system